MATTQEQVLEIQAKMDSQRLSVIEGPSHPPLLDVTFNDMLRERCEQHPHHVALSSHHQNLSITYAQLKRQSEDMAAGLYELGVRRGDRVGVLLGNRYEYGVIMFACSKMGAYFTLFNYAYTSSELLNALQATTPKVLFANLRTSRFDYASIFEGICREPSLSLLERIVLLEDVCRSPQGAVVSSTLGRRIMGYDDFMASGRISAAARAQHMAALERATHHSDILNLQFTSGSTGLPKTAALTHFGMLNSARYIGLQMGIKSGDRINVPVPLFHAFGLVIGLSAAVMSGASIVLPSEYFEAAATLEAVERYRCTGLYGVTTMFVDLLSHTRFPDTDRSSLRFGLMAGSAMPAGLLSRVKTSFPIRDIYTNWGMTELSSIATMTTASDPEDKKLRTAGRLLPNFACKIVDPADPARILGWGQRGEILVAGFGVMHSYYNQPERTAQAIVRCAQGMRWMRTGDEGYFDEQGYLVVTGRIKDLIIRGGENISPNEIEARLFRHPAVKQCAVFGVPDERCGEAVAVVLELSDGWEADKRPTDREIQTWVRQELSRYKVPVHIWWLGDEKRGVPSEWPKTANGKLRKGDIRQIGEELLKREAGQKPLAVRASL